MKPFAKRLEGGVGAVRAPGERVSQAEGTAVGRSVPGAR